MNRKHFYHKNVKLNLTAKIVIQIKIGTMINVDVSAKIWENITFGKKIILVIQVHILVKMENI